MRYSSQSRRSLSALLRFGAVAALSAISGWYQVAHPARVVAQPSVATKREAADVCGSETLVRPKVHSPRAQVAHRADV